MDDAKGSNAILAVASAYADALAGAREREAQQAALVARLSKELEPLRVAAAMAAAAEPIVVAARALVRSGEVGGKHMLRLRDAWAEYILAVDRGTGDDEA